MIENIHVVAFLTCDGVVHVGEIPTLGYPQVVHRQPPSTATGRANVTVPAVTCLICSAGGRFYGVAPHRATKLRNSVHNYVLVVDECRGGSVSLPHTHGAATTPEFDTVEQAIAYCDLVS